MRRLALLGQRPEPPGMGVRRRTEGPRRTSDSEGRGLRVWIQESPCDDASRLVSPARTSWWQELSGLLHIVQVWVRFFVAQVSQQTTHPKTSPADSTR